MRLCKAADIDAGLQDFLADLALATAMTHSLRASSFNRLEKEGVDRGRDVCGIR